MWTSLVVEDVMPVRKRAPLHVLPAESHVDALLHEGAERHGLRQRPVHLPLLHHLQSRVQDPLDAAVDLEVAGVGRARAAPLPDVGQRLLVHPGRVRLRRRITNWISEFKTPSSEQAQIPGKALHPCTGLGQPEPPPRM